MAEPTDMIMPMLREMREENRREFAEIKAQPDKHTTCLDRIEGRQKSFGQALAGDSVMSKMLVGDYEERIEALKKKVRALEASK
jgi:polyhydroxyalkanoate synthesis regulator phasin